MEKKPKVVLEEVNIPQTTISEVRSIEGKAAFIQGAGKLVFLPARPNTGIVFDIGGLTTTVPVSYDRLQIITDIHSTCLKATDSLNIMTTEHLLAAIRGLGISNLCIVTNSKAIIPFLDGSSLGFTDILIRGEIGDQPDYRQKRIIVKDPFRVEVGDSFATLKPDPGLVLSTAIKFPDPIGTQQLRYWHTPTMFCLHLAWARTFSFKDFTDKETSRAKLPGFELHHGDLLTESNMIIYKDGEHITDLRSSDEHVRHKLLDLMGDMALLPAPLQGSINIYRPSHALNHELLRVINEELKEAN
jgi:UDP-3-O-[3-hydroxymyristoyl] N-acetylglucosamine deacetylase